MKEIKFRAWSEINKRMEYDPSVGCAGGEDYEINYAFTDKSGTDDRVWMQYIGIKDKSGKEIFEGDIVKATPPGRAYLPCPAAVIEFDNYLTRFTAIRGKDRNIEPGGFDGTEIPYHWEVIGNIYENPELLKLL